LLVNALSKKAASAACLAFVLLFVFASPVWAVTDTWSPGGALAPARGYHTQTLLSSGKVLVAGGYTTGFALANNSELYDPATNIWSPAASLQTPRTNHTATLLPSGKVLVVGGGFPTPMASVELYDPGTNTWSNAASLQTPRRDHTATLLPSGKVLVVGGHDNIGGTAASAELYDPTANSWAPAGGVTNPAARQSHTATLLSSGKVLVTGGYGPGVLLSADLYDPVANTWAPAAPITIARYAHTATLLPSGKVLVAGGQNNSGTLASFELYDPGTNTWATPVGVLLTARNQHTATLLPSGQVLVAGGANGGVWLSSADVYDPASNTWVHAGALTTARNFHTATLLPTGQVLVAGGYNNVDGILNSAELYDPATDVWAAANTLNVARAFHTATLLPLGKVLVVAGSGNNLGPPDGGYLKTTELYDPATDAWAPAAPLASARTTHTATLLASGKVLVAGGTHADPFPPFSVTLNTAELYDPAADAWVGTANTLATARARHTATLLPSGKVLVAGGASNGTFLASAELYDPATNSWAPAGTLNHPRYAHTATLLASGKVLVAGGYNNIDSYLTSSELYDPVANSWTDTTGSLTTGRYNHTATLLPSGKVLVAAGSGSIVFLDSFDLYDPATETWAASAPGNTLGTGRYGHNATLLPSGKVMVVGGFGIGNDPVATPELYDPVTNTWAAAPTANATARLSPSATLLPSGQVLVAGGSLGATGNFAFLASADLYDTGLSPADSLQPGLSAVNAFLLHTSALAATSPGSSSTAGVVDATGFMPLLDGSGGATNNSASNAPVLQVQRIDNDQMLFVPNDESVNFTDTTFTGSASAFAGFPAGPVRVRVWVNGIPSAARSSALAVLPGTPAAPTASGGALQATVTFAAVDNGGAPITSYTATASPGGATASCTAPCTSIPFDFLAPGTGYTFTVRATNAAGDGAESAASNSVDVSQGVGTPSLTSDAPGGSSYGQTVTFTATVTGVIGHPPTGTVTFWDGAVPVTTRSLSSGVASWSVSTLSVASTPPHTIVAVYNGDPNYSGAGSNTVNQQVSQATSSTALISATNPSTFGQSVIFTATVTGQSPTGTATFKDGVTVICSAVALSSGSAGCTTSTLTVGSHSITAAYSGDTNNATSTSNTVAQQVNKAASSTTLISATNPSTSGQSVTFTATVTGQSPAGTATFKDGVTVICSAVTLTSGSAGCTTSTLTGGSHSITAAYSGDANNATSTSNTVTQQVKDVSTTSLISATNPSTFGQSVTFTATVNGQSPTGNVTFKNGASAICTNVALAAATASCPISSLTTGSHSITAVYSGDNNNQGSTSTALNQNVRAVSSIAISSACRTTFTANQSIEFTAVVTGSSPTGQVQFTDGFAVYSAVSLSGGTATFSTPLFMHGTGTSWVYQVTANYSGDSANAPSASTSLAVTVLRASDVIFRGDLETDSLSCPIE